MPKVGTPSSGTIEGSDVLCNLESLAEAALDEWRRSSRTGRSFAITRIGLSQSRFKTPENLQQMGRMLMANKRAIDRVGECPSGEYVLLTPETDNENVAARYLDIWETGEWGTGHILSEQRTYPRDGKTEAELMAWLGAGRLKASA